TRIEPSEAAAVRCARIGLEPALRGAPIPARRIAVVTLLDVLREHSVSTGRHRFELAHHLVVFVLEDVTVIWELAAVILEPGDAPDDFERRDLDGVLEPELRGSGWGSIPLRDDVLAR